MRKKKRSLKTMVVTLFFVGPFFIILCIILSSFQSIHSLITNKVEIVIEDNLARFSLDIESAMSDLNKVVYQFTDGFIGNAVNELEYTETPYQKAQLIKQIREQIELITFTHNDLNVISFYDKKNEKHVHVNKLVNEDIVFDDFPILAVKNQLYYYAPHDSIDKYIYNTCPVISLIKKVPHTNNELYVYIEANFDNFDSDYRTMLFHQLDFFAITNKQDKIIFSENTQLLPLETDITEISSPIQDFYIYSNEENTDYNVIYLIPKYEYDKETFLWIRQIIILILFFLIFTVFIILFLWKTMLRPIRLAEEEIIWIGAGNLDTVPRHTGVVEFDSLIDEIINMKSRISQYIRQEKEHESREAELEIEKLLYQINPHFLMNSLNTIYWMATLNGQPEIGRNVQALNKLLVYNLKHDSIMVALQDEVEALQHYLTLQKTRYNFEYSISYSADGQVMSYMVPRFILQPLVENSIYHGLSEENGKIDITIFEQNGLIINVSDNGKGIPSSVKEQILETQDTGHGNKKLGIGITYVLKILNNCYGSHASLNIESNPETGTTITVHIPVDYASDK